MPFCEIFVSFKDEKGEVSRSTFPCTIPDLSDASLAVDALVDLITPMTNGAIHNAGITFMADITTIDTIAQAGSDVQEGARFVFSAVGGFLKSVRLPTFLETFIVPGSKDVDTTAAEVVNFSTAILDGIDLTGLGGTGLVTFATTHDEDITALEKATEDWGKNR